MSFPDRTFAADRRRDDQNTYEDCWMLSSQQLIQLAYQLIEVGEGRIDGLGAFHIDAGIAEKIQRPLGAATLQER